MNADQTYAELLKRDREIDRLRAAIRAHRDQRGDDRCWQDDETLYAVLPEGYTAPTREVAVELEHCQRYLECRRNPATEYISPQREIERLTMLLRQVRSLLVIPSKVASLSEMYTNPYDLQRLIDAGLAGCDAAGAAESATPGQSPG